jgi:hypothetical protein
MSQIFETQEIAPEQQNKYAFGIRYGLMSGFVMMFITTIGFLYILKSSFVAFSILSVFTYVIPIIPLIFYVIAAKRQKSLQGGFISVKEAFQVMFIAILITVAIFTIYGLIYNKYIDPECSDRMKDGALSFFEKLKMPQDQIDAQMKKIEEQTNDSTKISKLFYSIAQSIIIHSIFGFIAALIIKKERPLTAS